MDLLAGWCFREISLQGGSGLLDQLLRLRHQLLADMGDLLKDGLHRNLGGIEVRQQMLHSSAENPADEDYAEEPYQHRGKPPAGMEVGVKKNQRETQKTKPQMGPHPGLHPAQTPDGYFLARAQEAGHQHEGEADDSADQPKSPAPAHPLRSRHRIGDENQRGHPQDYDAGNKPFSMCTVDEHQFSTNATAWPDCVTASTWRRIASGLPGARHHADKHRRNWARRGRGRDRRKSP